MKRLVLSIFAVVAVTSAHAQWPSGEVEAQRQARSVHLRWGGIVKDATDVVGYVNVTESQTNSYYMVIGFDGGYMGIPLGMLCAIKANEIIRFFEKVVNIIAHLGYTVRHIGTSLPAESFISIKLLDPEFYLTEVPIVVPFAEVFAIAAVTLILSVIVSLMPARKAAYEKPLEGLRKI